MSEPQRTSGGCLCGAVRFEVLGDLRPVIFCHCGQCRTQTGMYVGATDANDSALTVTGGDAVRWFRASEEAARGFCATCGSLLFWQRDGSDRTSIMAGAFEDGTPLVAASHIFVEDKPDWYVIRDGLPRYARSSRDGPPLAD